MDPLVAFPPVALPCIFCAIVEGKVPSHRVFATSRALAFLDIHPLRPGHTLVIPKKHASDLSDVTREDWGAVTDLVLWVAERQRQALGVEGSSLFVASGKAAEQSVGHLHVHVVPRRSDDGLAINEWWVGKVRGASPEELAALAQRLAPPPPS
jgi:histidine triad (HIT) family protein